MKLIRMLGMIFIGTLLMASTVVAAPMRTEFQLDILGQTGAGEDGWFVDPSADENWDNWCYAVTDLNHDGNLEILKARIGINDGKPQLQCEELLEGKWERHTGIKLAGGTHMPDILTGESAGQPGVIYDSQNKRYYYIFTEVLMHGEYDSTTTQYAISLDGDRDLSVEALASMEWQLSGYDGSVKNTFYRLTPLTEEINEDRYINITKELFPGGKESGAQIKWWKASEMLPYIRNGKVFRLLAESYNVFAGKNAG